MLVPGIISIKNQHLNIKPSYKNGVSTQGISMSFVLNLEEEFRLESFAVRVKDLTEAEAKDLLNEMFKEYVIREATYKRLLANKWGINPPASFIPGHGE